MTDFATVYAPVYSFPTSAELSSIAPGAEIEASADGAEARIVWPGSSIQLTRMPDEEMGPHLEGFCNYVRTHDGGEGLVVRVLSTLSVYGMVIDPGFDEAGRMMSVVATLTSATDGLCFLDGEIHDAGGTPLLFASAGPAMPSAERVARRALVLSTVSFRGLLEQDAGTADERDADQLRVHLANWLRRDPQLVAEAEPAELELLETAIGKADPQQIIDAVWRAEGLQVLLWALDARALPAHDAQEHPYEVARSIGVLADGPSALLDQPVLRSSTELEWMRRRLLALHWRVTEHRVDPGPRSFAGLATDSWFGGFDPNGIAVAADDLAIGEQPITAADPELVARTTSIAVERHQAINWLIGAHPTYSRVATPT